LAIPDNLTVPASTRAWLSVGNFAKLPCVKCSYDCNKWLILSTKALSFFDAQIDALAMSNIDKIREKINDIKHDPLSHRVDHQQYRAAVQAFQAFWDRMVTLETGIEQG
jgi:hypothetical protein